MNVPAELKGARCGIVLGSGLGAFVDGLDVVCSFAFDELGLPSSKVPGHEGRMLLVRAGDIPLLVAQGRVHLYEGWQADEVARGVRFMHSAGARALVLTNAAGSVNPEFSPGSWMMLSDHLNLTGQTPLAGGANFVDMAEVYSRRLRGLFRAASNKRGRPLHEGVYAAVHGPQYETPAEIRMLGLLGADAVGMSTVLEAIQARALGIEVAAFSCLTNWAAGLSGQPLSHEDVTAAGRAAASAFAEIFRDALPEI